MSTLFLTEDELVQLTGRRLKSHQILRLKAEGIPFRVNATGHPVVTRSAIESRDGHKPEAPKAWTPRVIGGSAGG